MFAFLQLFFGITFMYTHIYLTNIEHKQTMSKLKSTYADIYECVFIISTLAELHENGN